MAALIGSSPCCTNVFRVQLSPLRGPLLLITGEKRVASRCCCCHCHCCCRPPPSLPPLSPLLPLLLLSLSPPPPPPAFADPFIGWLLCCCPPSAFIIASCRHATVNALVAGHFPRQSLSTVATATTTATAAAAANTKPTSMPPPPPWFNSLSFIDEERGSRLVVILAGAVSYGTVTFRKKLGN